MPWTSKPFLPPTAKPPDNEIMSQDNKDIFTRISNPDEREKIAQDVARLKPDLLCKAEASDDIIPMEVSRIEQKFRLVCRTRAGAKPPIPLPVSVILSFSIGSDRFFMTTDIVDLGGGYYEVNFAKDIFQLQRRQSYRIRIPDNHFSDLKITVSNNNAVTNLSGRIVDISSGGARMLLKHADPVLKLDDKVEGTLVIGRRAPIAYQGVVRHVKVESQKPPAQIIGVEFTGMTPVMEGKLFAITMELHRELFARWEK